MTTHKCGLAAKYSFQIAARSHFFRDKFFSIVGISEAETSVSGKAECLLAICKLKTKK